MQPWLGFKRDFFLSGPEEACGCVPLFSSACRSHPFKWGFFTPMFTAGLNLQGMHPALQLWGPPLCNALPPWYVHIPACLCTTTFADATMNLFVFPMLLTSLVLFFDFVFFLKMRKSHTRLQMWAFSQVEGAAYEAMAGFKENWR